MLKSIFFGKSLLIIPSLLQAKPFTDNGDSTVTDQKTGLVWQQSTGSQYSWESALSYCESLTLASNSDWRLPNIKELGSIVYHSLSYPTIDSTAFPGTQSWFYWSSTTSLHQTSYAWSVHFGAGSVYNKNKSNNNYVRCVRGG